MMTRDDVILHDAETVLCDGLVLASFTLAGVTLPLGGHRVVSIDLGAGQHRVQARNSGADE